MIQRKELEEINFELMQACLLFKNLIDRGFDYNGEDTINCYNQAKSALEKSMKKINLQKLHEWTTKQYES